MPRHPLPMDPCSTPYRPLYSQFGFSQDILETRHELLVCKRPMIGRGAGSTRRTFLWVALLVVAGARLHIGRGLKAWTCPYWRGQLWGCTLSLPPILQLTAISGWRRIAWLAGLRLCSRVGFASLSLPGLYSPYPCKLALTLGSSCLTLTHHPFPPPPPFTLYTGRRANSERRCAPSASWYPCHWCRPASGEVSELKRSMLMGGSGRGLTEARRCRFPPCHGHVGRVLCVCTRGDA